MRRSAYGDVDCDHVVRNEADNTAGRTDAWSVRTDAEERRPVHAAFEMRCAPPLSLVEGPADPAVRRRPGVEAPGSRTQAGEEKSGPVAHGLALTSEMAAMPLGTGRRLQPKGKPSRENVRLCPRMGKDTHLVDRWNRPRPVRRSGRGAAVTRRARRSSSAFPRRAGVGCSDRPRPVGRLCRGAAVKRRGRRSSSGFPGRAGASPAAADYQSRAQRESQERNDPPRGRAHRGKQRIPGPAGVAEAQLGRPPEREDCERDEKGSGGEREGLRDGGGANGWGGDIG
jgi:hypothetical protein